MNPWLCALLITVAGAIGGVVNALLSDNGFALPRRESGVWCPGAISNILIRGVRCLLLLVILRIGRGH